MGMKTWVLILIAAYAANRYLRKMGQRLEEAGAGGTLSGSSAGGTSASSGRQMLDQPQGVERLRQTSPGSAFGGLASSRGDGNVHDDVLSPSSGTTLPG
jgi:hypothetical protein